MSKTYEDELNALLDEAEAEEPTIEDMLDHGLPSDAGDLFTRTPTTPEGDADLDAGILEDLTEEEREWEEQVGEDDEE